LPGGHVLQLVRLLSGRQRRRHRLDRRCINLTFGAGQFCDIIPDTKLNGTGVLGGLQVGYNFQRGAWVFGVEGDGQGTSLRGSSTLTGAFPLNGTGLTDPASTVYSGSGRINWLATLRGRVGVTVGPALVYATAGAAFGGVQTATNIVGPVNAYPASSGPNRSGWTAGAGAEWGFAQHWSAKLEGLYYDLGSFRTMGTSVPPIAAFQEGARLTLNGWIARVGVNYRFGGPVVAKY
jgi:outer membrane immunogenic protein